MLDPDDDGVLLITAGHNLFDRKKEFTAQIGYLRSPGLREQTIVFDDRTAFFYTPLKADNIMWEGNPTKDWGFIYITSRIFSPKVFRAFRSLEYRHLQSDYLPATLSVTGYPLVPPPGQPASMFTAANLQPPFTPAGSLLAYDAATSKGNSGSPVTEGTGANQRVIAVHTGTRYDVNEKPEYNRAVRLSSIVAAVRTQVAAIKAQVAARQSRFACQPMEHYENACNCCVVS